MLNIAVNRDTGKLFKLFIGRLSHYLFEYFTSSIVNESSNEEESSVTWKSREQCNEFWLKNWVRLIYVLLLAGTTLHKFTNETFISISFSVNFEYFKRNSKQKNANSQAKRHVKVMFQ